MSVRRFLTFALIAAGGLPLLVFGLAFSVVLGKQILGETRSLSQSMLRSLAAQADSSLLVGAERNLPALLLLAESSGGVSREADLLKSFRLPHAEYTLLAVRDEASGRIEAVDPPESGASGRAYALHAGLRPGEVSFSDPFHSDLTRAVSVEAAYSNGHKTVLALLDLGEISSKLVLIAQSPSDRLGIVDGRGRYLACSDPSRAQRLESVDASCLVPGPARVKSEGHEYYASSRELQGTAWRVLYLRAAPDADAPMTTFVGSILGILASALVCTAIIAFFAWKNISTPLSALVRRIDRIAEGHYAERVEGEFSTEFKEIGRAFNAMADSIGKRERELQRSEERYRLLFHRNRVPALIVEPGGGAIRDANDAALSYYGYAREELAARVLGDIDRSPAGELKAQLRSAADGWEGRILSRHLLRSGEARDVELYMSPVELQGEADLYCIVFDVTQRRLAEERTVKALKERTLLLREVYHRVKNNLQIVSSLLNLQAEGLEEAAALRALRLAQDRVYAMSLAHELVYQVPDLAYIEASDYAGQLISNLEAAYAVPDGSVVSDLRQMKLELERAIPFGLVLNELVSNAFKYAKPSRAQPVRIAFGPGDDGVSAVFVVEDSGPGIPAEAFDVDGKSGSIGLSLVSALSGQIGGTVSWGTGPGGAGARAELRFPASAQGGKGGEPQ
jgi:PAS domain S-box-containing protein